MHVYELYVNSDTYISRSDSDMISKPVVKLFYILHVFPCQLQCGEHYFWQGWYTMKTSFVYIPVVWKKSQRWRFEATDLCSSTILRLKKGFYSK